MAASSTNNPSKKHITKNHDQSTGSHLDVSHQMLLSSGSIFRSVSHDRTPGTSSLTQQLQLPPMAIKGHVTSSMSETQKDHMWRSTCAHGVG